MRKNQIKGVVHDLLHLLEDFHLLNYIWLKNKFELNLLTGKINYPGDDSISDFFKKKREWFIHRIKSLNGNLSDFETAKIICFGAKEKVEIVYKGEKFEDEIVYKTLGKEFRECREEIKKMKAVKIKLK